VGSYSCGAIAQLQLLPLFQTIQRGFIRCLQWRYGSQMTINLNNQAAVTIIVLSILLFLYLKNRLIAKIMSKEKE
jgi:hypothetical protein